MRSFWSDPYLWIHLAGVASVPLWLELCLLGLAVGDPILPVWLELLLVGTVSIGPIVWMQWQRPFNIYSLLAVSLKPERLTEEQRKLLTLFTMPRNQYLAVGVAIALAFVLQQVYLIAPIAATMTPFAASGRVIGLLVAAIAFLGANLFLQVPVAVLSVLLSSEAAYATTLPFATDQIRQRFLPLGWPVNQILPPLIAAAPMPSVPAVARPTETTPAIANPQALAAPVNPDEFAQAAEDLEDIWETADETPASDLSVSPPLTFTETPPLAPSSSDEQPELAQPDVKTDVKTEETSFTELSTAETIATSEAETEAADQSWLDAAPLVDPAAVDPPNSL
ncbi:MAG: low-complexity tail membrane protein [Leptolyngbyaceae cyanobacterium bins.349]|nr:low-complexity tail membrane protein [Leptolyngbyaceae cyanobacterium bins.349]